MASMHSLGRLAQRNMTFRIALKSAYEVFAESTLNSLRSSSDFTSSAFAIIRFSLRSGMDKALCSATQ